MDDRVRRYLEGKAGVPLSASPIDGIVVRESPKRTDERGNRVFAQRVAGWNGVLVTVEAASVDAIRHAVRQMTSCEVFSPFGRAELCRALGRGDEPPPQYYLYGFNYVLTSLEGFCPAETTRTATPLRKKDIPREQFEMRMSQRRPVPAEDFIWAFACYRDDPTFRTTELALFGAQCASIAIAMWQEGPVATYGVATEEACRGQGFGVAAVSAITKWVLEQGEAAVYEAYANNIPSLRIARRLGFAFLQQEMSI
jgi:RimJ/RimL family protein N-acetyltransferase